MVTITSFMGLFKVIAGVVAAKSLSNRLKQPTVTPIDAGITILGIKPDNAMASKWRITYCLDGRTNMKRTTTVNRSTRGINIGGRRCEIFWP